MSNPSEEKISREVWQKYQESKSVALRNKILMEYLYIVTVNAKRMSAVYQNKAEMEDIVNQGIIALMESIERYDWTKNVQFDSFASIRVRGSIIDYMRKQDWIPRDIRKKSIDINKAYNYLQSKLDKTPSEEEVAEYLDISLAELNNILAQSQSFALLSYERVLQEGIPAHREPKSHLDTPEQNMDKLEMREVLASAIDKLNENERLVVSLYYYEELKLKEIAVVLGLTASRVSQLHAKALSKLEKSISNYIER